MAPAVGTSAEVHGERLLGVPRDSKTAAVNVSPLLATYSVLGRLGHSEKRVEGRLEPQGSRLLIAGGPDGG